MPRRRGGSGAPAAPCCSLLFLLLALLCAAFSLTSALKPEDWKKCADAPFCAKLRALPGPGHDLDISTIEVKGSTLTAELVERKAEVDASNATTTATGPTPLLPNPGRLRLTLTAFSGGSLRVRVSELDSRRFEPTSSLRDDLDAWEVPWTSVRGEEVDLGSGGGGGGTGLLFDAHSGGGGGPRVLLSPSPFRLDLLPPPPPSKEERKSPGALPVPLAVFNGAGGLLFQRRGASLPPPAEPPEEGASSSAASASSSSSSPYPEELFKSHRDSVPFGPQAVGFDLSFPGAAFVSGLPERAKRLALPSTLAGPPPRGQPSVPGIDPASGQQTMSRFRDEPYRLYNLDVFEYLDDSSFGLYGSIPMLVAHAPAGGVAAAAAAGNAALRAAAASAAEGRTGKKKKASSSSSSSSPPISFEAVGGEAPRTVGAFWNNAAEMYVDVAAPPPSSSPSLSPVAAAPPPFLTEPGVTSTFAGAALTTHWLAEAGVVDLFLYGGSPAVPERAEEGAGEPAAADAAAPSPSSPAAVAAAHARATGTTALPQLFSLGYHQCRWNYRDEADARAVDAGFDAHAMPYDVLWLDIEHTDGKRYFTWDADLFPRPRELIGDIASRGRKVVAIVDPHVKRDEGYRIYSEARKRDFFVKDRGGERDFEGWCWPGASAYLDMLLPAARKWWSSQFSLDKYSGSTPDLYIWNDMNEPSVFNGPEITMPKDARHRVSSDGSLSKKKAPKKGGGKDPDDFIEHREAHNVFGALFHAATAQGLGDRGRAARGPDGDRPFVLSRAFFAGSQTAGPIWTGDNSASWPQLRVSVPMLLSLGLAGLPASGADVGGFFGDPDPELLTRWYQLGLYYPFFRGHAHLDAARREPWLSGEPHTARVRAALRERYRLLPYLYSVFREANVTGAPVMRPMFWEWPEEKDVALAAADDQFLVGRSLLVAPALYPAGDAGGLGLRRSVWLPSGGGERWFDSVSGVEEKIASPSKTTEVVLTAERAPAWLRGGSVVPLRERPRRSTAAARRDPLTLVVALDASGGACGDLYLDDGATFAFARGAFASRKVCFDARSGELTNRAAAGPLASPARAASWRGPLPGWRSGVSVNRVVVLGLPEFSVGGGAPSSATKGGSSSPSSWRAVLVEGGSREIDAAPGPLTLGPGAPVVGVVIRKPEVAADGDWTIRLVQQK